MLSSFSTVKVVVLWLALGVAPSPTTSTTTLTTTIHHPFVSQQLLPTHHYDNSLPQLHNLVQQQQGRRRVQWKQLLPKQLIVSRKKHRQHHGAGSTSNRECGTRLFFQRPTPDSVAQWFSSSSLSLVGHEFNHDSVGMTNPCLHISLTPSSDNGDNTHSLSDLLVSHVSSAASSGQQQRSPDNMQRRASLPAASSSSSSSSSGGSDGGGSEDHVEDSWWPHTSCQDSNNSNNQQPAWRVARYRRRIGRGQECYERVRNAALDWEFAFGNQQQQQQDDQSQGATNAVAKVVVEGEGQEMGILAVHPQTNGKRRMRYRHHHDENEEDAITTPPWIIPASHRDAVTAAYGRGVHQPPSREEEDDRHSSSSSSSSWDDGENVYAPLTRDAARHVLQLWSGPGGRRLVTYTGTSGHVVRMRCLPRLFVVNPVMVVYDLIDQRGPGTTYTSTAYATLKGHWLSGEERVTVALRDGVHGDVDVEIVSFSRPAPTLAGKLIWPFVGRRQRDFFERQLQALEQVSRQYHRNTGAAGMEDTGRHHGETRVGTLHSPFLDHLR